MIPFEEYCKKVARHIEERYGIRVVTRDVPDPLLGDLNGSEIHIDYALTPEQRLFLLAHLFGHTVQWNARPETIELGRPCDIPVAEAMLPALMEYEERAAEYALSMLREIGTPEIDQWLSNFSASDIAYLHHYYVTGEKRSFHSFWREDASLIQPCPIPAFRVTRHAWRSDGIVI